MGRAAARRMGASLDAYAAARRRGELLRRPVGNPWLEATRSTARRRSTAVPRRRSRLFHGRRTHALAAGARRRREQPWGASATRAKTLAHAARHPLRAGCAGVLAALAAQGRRRRATRCRWAAGA